MGRIDVAADVECQRAAVRHILRGDRAGVAECLRAVGRRARRIAREVLVVHEDMGAVRADEACDVRIHAIGNIGDLHALARYRLAMAVQHLLRLRGGGIGEGGVGELQRLRLQGVAQRARGVRCGSSPGTIRDSTAVVARVPRRPDHRIGHHRPHQRIGRQMRRLRRRNRGGHRIDQPEGADVRCLHLPQLGDDRRLRRSQGLRPDLLQAGCGRQVRLLVAQDHDHLGAGVLRELLHLGRRKRAGLELLDRQGRVQRAACCGWHDQAGGQGQSAERDGYAQTPDRPAAWRARMPRIPQLHGCSVPLQCALGAADTHEMPTQTARTGAKSTTPTPPTYKLPSPRPILTLSVP